MKYFYNCWLSANDKHSIVLGISGIAIIVGGTIWLYLKYPLFIIEKNKELDETFYNKTYCKNIGFWQCLFIEMFYLVRQNNEMVSLFSGNVLAIGIKNKICQFSYNANFAKLIHRVLDIVLTIICSTMVFFLCNKLTEFGVIFGIIVAVFAVFSSFRIIILNHIFSVKIGKYEGYNINIMYPHSPMDGMFFKKYGFAYYINNTILIHKDVFCGNDVLKKYVLSHETGHLKITNKTQNFWLISIFIIMTFFGAVGSGFLSQISDNKNNLVILVPAIIYIIFLYFYNKITSEKSKKDEFNADIYAIKTIGKEAVLEGLEIIKDENMSKEVKFSGISIDERIGFVKKYQEQ